MPEPCYPKGRIPRVDWRAWAIETRDPNRSPRQRDGYWHAIGAAIIQERVRLGLTPTERT